MEVISETTQARSDKLSLTSLVRRGIQSSRCRRSISRPTHCPRTGAYSSIPAAQAPTSPPHHNDSPLSPSPSVEHSELQEVVRKGLRLRSQDES
ncbi:hypothetical protein YC2023_094585 [Brassica napus]